MSSLLFKRSIQVLGYLRCYCPVMARGAFRDEEFRFDFFGYGLECGKDGVVCWVAGRGLAAARANRILDERSYNFG